ncbi:MAG: Rpn family recombination-promoting nuclease/putative transposase [Nodosilinea sp.]|jgi:predicted transposase/invertase (TIGR01784 family)
MRRDSIFYKLFAQYPQVLFQLLPDSPTNAAAYRFDSVAVKEPNFTIDGIFLPPAEDSPGVVYFCEVQFQRDARLYERLFAESFLYFYRNREQFTNWAAVVIYPSRRIEQPDCAPYQALLASPQVNRVYLEELGNIRQLPLGLALLVLTTLTNQAAPAEARYILERTQTEVTDPTVSPFIIEMVTTIIAYQFTQLSRQEVEAMLGLNIQETRLYQEAKEDGAREVMELSREEIEARLSLDIEDTPIYQEGRQEGSQAEAVRLVQRLLRRRLGEVPDEVLAQVRALALPQLEDLGEALLDVTTLAELTTWLQSQGQND